MSGFRRWVGSVDRRDALIATVLIGWLALIGLLENTGSAPAVGERPITCRIVSVSVTEPASVDVGLGGRAVAEVGGAIELVGGRRMRIVPDRFTSSIDSSRPAGKRSARYVELRAGPPTYRRTARRTACGVLRGAFYRRDQATGSST